MVSGRLGRDVRVGLVHDPLAADVEPDELGLLDETGREGPVPPASEGEALTRACPTAEIIVVIVGPFPYAYAGRTVPSSTGVPKRSASAVVSGPWPADTAGRPRPRPGVRLQARRTVSGSDIIIIGPAAELLERRWPSVSVSILIAEQASTSCPRTAPRSPVRCGHPAPRPWEPPRSPGPSSWRTSDPSDPSSEHSPDPPDGAWGAV